MTLNYSEVADATETRADSRSQTPAPRPEVAPWRVYHVGFGAPGQVEVFHYDEEGLPEDCFRVRTLYCGVSTGTELTHFMGTNPYLKARWDDRLKLFVEDGAEVAYPLPFSGYMQVGRVEATRTGAVREGEIVAMSYGHKTGHTADTNSELFFRLPKGLDPMLGIYVAQMGPICANGILHADEEAYGEQAQSFGAGVRGSNVVVCGTGVVGLLTAMMCAWAGAHEVAVVGRNPWKLAVAESLGLIPVNTREVDVGPWAKQRWHDGAGSRGAHVAFQCTGSDELLHHAFRAVQPQAAVIDLGFYQGGAEQVLLGREFHHNGLKHICAQIFRVPRKLSAHWDRRRLAAETIAFLQAEGDRIRERLITHTFPFHDAQEAFDLLARDGGQVLQVVLRCE
jgi:zinc-binding dehydrogenase